MNGSVRQSIHNKPTKWGFKLWCLCDSHNGYTSSFSVYHGEVRSPKSLGYNVVAGMQDYLSQGYTLYIDNFYTSPTLVSDLYDHMTLVFMLLVLWTVPVLQKFHSWKSKWQKNLQVEMTVPMLGMGYAYMQCGKIINVYLSCHSESKITRNVNDKEEKVPIQSIVAIVLWMVWIGLTNWSRITISFARQENTGRHYSYITLT